ncbi:MAG TPA: hypothetical protein VK968_05480 [Roseimicrobium sp.]|nr:hypothetical protein [Roseimicrobium sp.]
MKASLLLLAVISTLFVAGCASTSSDHAGHGMMMKCGMCSCKTPKADPADAKKCAMCKHMMSDHKADAAAPAAPATEHKH